MPLPGRGITLWINLLFEQDKPMNKIWQFMEVLSLALHQKYAKVHTCHILWL